MTTTHFAQVAFFAWIAGVLVIGGIGAAFERRRRSRR